MKTKIVTIIILLLILIFSGIVFAQTQEKSLNLLIDIHPYIELEIGEDMNIDVEQPWQGGEIREVTSQLNLKTNTEVELSWQTTKLTNKKTGRSLPLGIPTDFVQRLSNGKKVEAVDQPFGLNTFLINTASLQTYNISKKNKKKDNHILASIVKDKEILQSTQGFILNPGVYDFDIIVQYYWAKESIWSHIIAGEYKGQIIYTVAAVEDVSE